MKESTSDHKLINLISFLVLAGRFLMIVLTLSLAGVGGFSNREVWGIFYITGPLTMVYFISFARFVVRYPYTVERKKLGLRSSGAGVLFTVVMTAVFILGIATNGLFKLVLTFQTLKLILFFGELLNACFVAVYLSFLFEIRDRESIG